MANLTRLTDRLFTGGDLPENEKVALTHLAEWAALGVRLVIDNRGEWSDARLVAAVLPDVVYVHNGVDDAGQEMPDEWFDTGVDAALALWAREPDAGVIAHCHMGINRGPSLAYAILLALGHDPIEAIDLIRRRRPIAAVDYAEDALEWYFRRHAVPTGPRREIRRRLAVWRSEHPHDTVRIIREIRAKEAA